MRESRKSRSLLDGSPLMRHGCRRIVFHVPFPERRERGISGVDVTKWTQDQLPLIPFRPCATASNYLCSLGTNTVLGNSTNGLFGVLPDDGPVN